MMNELNIRLGQTDSINSVNVENRLDVEIKNTSNLIRFNNVKETIDQYEQFLQERNDCSKYRLILTINPFCSNVLFNPVTEIIKDEGSDSCKVVADNSPANFGDTHIQSFVYGNLKPTRNNMIDNTEYSRDVVGLGYEYHPGYDIFNNHILRNVSFKVVNKLLYRSGINSDDSVFNTISDFRRTPDGENIPLMTRANIENVRETEKSHLYIGEDILSFQDSINANLIEQDGWYGFINASNIPTNHIETDGENKNKKSLGIEHVLNNKKPCELVDMYPDRTLYSFTPKFNKFRHRLEHNWDIVLTYPKSHSWEEYKILNEAGEAIGSTLPAITATKSDGVADYVIIIRSALKHQLKRGDRIRLYYNYDEGGWKEFGTYKNGELIERKLFSVTNLGNLADGDEAYYFYLNDKNFEEILFDNLPTTITEIDYSKLKIRFARDLGGYKSEYYVRKFAKVPNLKFKTRDFDPYNETFDEYLSSDVNVLYEFDKEQYKLGFASTAYNDDATQVAYTDTIDIDNLTDDFGRPVTELYVTVLKTNRGHEKWYNDHSYTDGDIEFSHCFGYLSAGLDISAEKSDSEVDELKIKKIRDNYGDVKRLTSLSEDETDSTTSSLDIYEKDITIGDGDTEFLGDVVEYNSQDASFKVIDTFQYRFNTHLRELGEPTSYYQLGKYNEIEYDDYNPRLASDEFIKGFEISENDMEGCYHRPEGYYYQPHYKIQVREFGPAVYGQHKDLKLRNVNGVKDVSLYQSNGLYIRITTSTRSGADTGNIVYLFDDENDKYFVFNVVYVESPVTFYVSPMSKMTDVSPWQRLFVETEEVYTGGLNPLDVVNLVRNGVMKFRIRNNDIPYYAEKIKGVNKYVWREVLRVGDNEAKELPEYNYANDAFYITKEINFFLKRQDPEGINGLQASEIFPNDIPGNIKKKSNYVYKREVDVKC